MKQTISKCDKCKKQTDVLIDITMVNPYHHDDYKTKEDKMYEQNPFGFLVESPSNHPTVKLELCEDCTKILFHWCSHPENEFFRAKV